eukprot:gnl/TRDRNA2_/TRDRNA2_30353_c0_seq1.p1 gnl/TRDRNA2_/TRDRNA2_30353_c0~~gnl/TRDRNA2_/TRDRNA2_30353_c0_seq1.p1  ORF type:complete len:392 (-),score=72.82 gnl/TRDRNA2_/TRDRNA2_30353_c0_seq1:63-1238(-)
MVTASMAPYPFAAGFSPTGPQCGQKPKVLKAIGPMSPSWTSCPSSPVLTSQGGSPEMAERVFSEAELPPLELEEHYVEEEEAISQSPTSKHCQFAPMLQMRRTQALEATAAHALQMASEEDPLHDALDVMDAVLEAARSADRLLVKLSCEPVPINDASVAADFDSPGPTVDWQEVEGESPDSDCRDRRRCESPRESEKSSPSLGPSQQVLVGPAMEPIQLEIDEVLEDDEADEEEEDEGVSARLVAGTSSILSMLASAALGQGPCVEGILRVDSDLAVDIAPLREIFRTVMRRLFEPRVQVKSVALTTLNGQHGSILYAPSGAGVCDSCAFSYRIYVVDPHDIEVIQETLLLEAECGGARQLLPLLADQLCEENRPMPKRLKVRIEVQGGR